MKLAIYFTVLISTLLNYNHLIAGSTANRPLLIIHSKSGIKTLNPKTNLNPLFLKINSLLNPLLFSKNTSSTLKKDQYKFIDSYKIFDQGRRLEVNLKKSIHGSLLVNNFKTHNDKKSFLNYQYKIINNVKIENKKVTFYSEQKGIHLFKFVSENYRIEHNKELERFRVGGFTLEQFKPNKSIKLEHSKYDILIKFYSNPLFLTKPFEIKPASEKSKESPVKSKKILVKTKFPLYLNLLFNPRTLDKSERYFIKSNIDISKIQKLFYKDYAINEIVDTKVPKFNVSKKDLNLIYAPHERDLATYIKTYLRTKGILIKLLPLPKNEKQKISLLSGKEWDIYFQITPLSDGMLNLSTYDKNNYGYLFSSETNNLLIQSKKNKDNYNISSYNLNNHLLGNKLKSLFIANPLLKNEYKSYDVTDQLKKDWGLFKDLYNFLAL